MTRIGVISDTHIPDRAETVPQRILDDFKKVDLVIHVGDLIELRVLEELRSVCKKVSAVWGNMDSDEVREKLPEKDIVEVAKFKIGVMHGYGPPNQLIKLVTEEFKNNKVDIIIFGHSHIPFKEKMGDILYFNPGSPTDKIFSPFNSYGIIELGNKIEAKIVKL